MGTDGQENSSTGWPRCAAHSSEHKLYRYEGKLSCRDCWTGIGDMWTCLEADDGGAMCIHLGVGGDAESQLRDNGQLDSC